MIFELALVGINFLAYIVGMLVILPKLGWWIITFVNRQVLRKRLDFKKRYGEGSWACVTGCTDGIGEAIAIELAKEGLNLVLLSRCEEKLKETEAMLKKVNPTISTSIVVADLSTSSNVDFFSEIADRVNKHDISMLINNAGLAPLGRLDTADASELRDMISTNCLPIVLLTKFIVNNMVKRKKRSAVMFTSSVFALHPAAGGATYGATKVFIDFFARGIAFEFSHKIDTLVLRPCFVHTKADPLSFILSPEKCAQGALRDLGQQLCTSGYVTHDLQASAVSLWGSLIPEWITAKFSMTICAYTTKRQIETGYKDESVKSK